MLQVLKGGSHPEGAGREASERRRESWGHLEAQGVLSGTGTLTPVATCWAGVPGKLFCPSVTPSLRVYEKLMQPVKC